MIQLGWRWFFGSPEAFLKREGLEIWHRPEDPTRRSTLNKPQSENVFADWSDFGKTPPSPPNSSQSPTCVAAGHVDR